MRTDALHHSHTRTQTGAVTDFGEDRYFVGWFHGPSMADDDTEALRVENRKLRARIKHLEDELANAKEQIAFLAQELTRIRARLPRGPSTS